MDLTGKEGVDFYRGFRALKKESVVSGSPLVVVTPAASGWKVLDLAQTIFNEPEDPSANYLSEVVRAWVPISSDDVMQMSPVELKVLPKRNIKVLAIHGENDSKGKKSNKFLRKAANATTKMIEGDHACYFDSPQVFVELLVEFLDEVYG